jgi:membrane dipeptidase
MAPRLPRHDGPTDPLTHARALGVTDTAGALLADADFVDLHLDVEVPARLFGWDPTIRHRTARRSPAFFGHTDYPRLIEAGFTGVAHDIATNPFRRPESRQRTTLANLDRVVARVERYPDDLAIARTRAEYDAARRTGRLAVLPCLQGGNAFSHDPDVLDGDVGRTLHRITLVHLTNSDLGGTSSPQGRNQPITDKGRAFVAACNRNRVLVDLAHASKATFWGAIEAHDTTLPPVVTHTGVDGARVHWRNLDDDQIRAIADRGGVVGVIYESKFLAETWGRARRADVVRHLDHLIRVGGEDVAAIGTDYDGFIVPPGDLPDVTMQVLLVQDLLDAGWTEARIRRVLGANFLRVLGQVRP